MNSRTEGKVIRVKNFAFKLDDLIGKGATGKVYKGTNENNGEQVAIKIIQMSKIDNQVTQYLLACQKDALMSISNPYVLTAYDIIQTQQDCLIVTPLCSGGTLKQHITSKGKLPEQESLLIFVKLLRGYLAIRNKGFVHRDIKSSNVMFRNGEPLIIDFGYCEKNGSKKPKMFYNVGSPSYMSPEAYFKTLYSQKSDIWSLGIVLYEMIEGFTIDHGQPIDRYFSSLMKNGFAMRSKVSDNVKHLLKWILNPNFHERPSVEPLIQNVQKIIFSGNSMNHNQSNQRAKVAVEQNQNEKQQPVRISLKQSQRRAQQIFQQKLVESRQKFNNQFHQHQGNHNLVQNPPIQMVRQSFIGPPPASNKVMHNQLFDRNLVKLSESIYRPQYENQHSISSINNGSKMKQVIVNHHQTNPIPVQQPLYNQQFVFQNKPQVQNQFIPPQTQIIPPQSQFNQPQQFQQPQPQPQHQQIQQIHQSQIIPQNIQSTQIPYQHQNVQMAPQSPNLIQYAPTTQSPFNNNVPVNNFFQANPLKMAPEYRSMIETQNKNQSRSNILENVKNFKVSHSKLFNAESILSVESNQAFQRFAHFNNVPITSSVHHNRVISEQPRNISSSIIQNQVRRPTTSVVQSLIVDPQRNLADSFHQKNQVFHSFIAEEQRQPQPQIFVKNVHQVPPPPTFQNFPFVEQNGMQMKQTAPLNNHRIPLEHRQFEFQPFQNHRQVHVHHQNNRPFSPVASERQNIGEFFRAQRFGPQQGTARNFTKKAEPYFHMPTQIPAEHMMGRQTMPSTYQRTFHTPIQNNFHRQSFIQQPLIHLKR